jgi:uncharacterized protein (DUF58 family)
MRLVHISAAFVLAFVGTLLTGSAAEAHQCIQVELVAVPQTAVAGEAARVHVAVKNCGEATRAGLDFYLVHQEGRIHVGSERVRLRVDGGERVHTAIRIPPNTRPGRYSLLVIGRTPSGFTSIDQEVIHIRAADPPPEHPQQ